jgi:RHS repeat-associated protein
MGSLVQSSEDASGLMYRRNRYYDPKTGRFTQEDPIGLAGGLNTYGFADGDPVSYTDPYGLSAEDCCSYSQETGHTADQNVYPTGRQVRDFVNRNGVDIIVAAVGGGLAAWGESLMVRAGVRGATSRTLAGSIRGVNPTGGTANCVNCAIATDATLAGARSVALPGSATAIGEIEKFYGRRFAPVASIQAAEGQLRAAGNGARAIIFGYRGPGQVGHVFNGVNQGGTVRFLDGQIGKSASLAGYKSFHILRTN